MKFALVSADPVATTFAPDTISPESVSFSTCTHTSAISSAGRSRSIGGCTIAWLRYSSRSWVSLYQRSALSLY